MESARRYGAAIAVAGALMLGGQGVVRADDSAGEMWNQVMSMQMAGMSMPPRTLQVCVPVGKAKETFSRPQGGPGMNSDNCSVQDAKQEANKFTAKFICTGKQPMQGTIETVVQGDHVKSTMTMSMAGRDMTMVSESTKLGTPCTPKVAPGAK